MSYLDDLFGLQGRVAVVIGGYGVLAGAMAEALAMAGANLAVLGPREEQAAEKAESIRETSGREAMGIHADASSKEDLQRARDEIVSKWARVDVVINAAGINSPTPFVEISEQEWDRIMDVNLKSMFLSCQVFGAAMIEQGEGGSIINLSSVSSLTPLSKVFTYGVSKAGINNMTQFLAREWAPHGIRVNALVPGFFPAKQNRKILKEERIKAVMGHTPMARFGEPGDLIGATLWLASQKASSFVTGAVVCVDGGYTAMTI